MGHPWRRWWVRLFVAAALCAGLFVLYFAYIPSFGSRTELLPPAFSADRKQVYFFERTVNGFYFYRHAFAWIDFAIRSAPVRVTAFIWRDTVWIRRLHLDSGRIEVVRTWPVPWERSWAGTNSLAPLGTLMGGFGSRWGRPGYAVGIGFPSWAVHQREGLWDRRTGVVTESGQWRGLSEFYNSVDGKLAAFRDSQVILWRDCALALYDGGAQTARLLYQARGCEASGAVQEARGAGDRAAAEQPPAEPGREGRPEGWRARLLSPQETASVRLTQRTEFDVDPYVVVSDAELSSVPDLEEAIRNPARRVDRAGHYSAPDGQKCDLCNGLNAIASHGEGYVENNGRVFRIQLLKERAPGAADETPSPAVRAGKRASVTRTDADRLAAERAALQTIANISDQELSQIIRTIVDAAGTHFDGLRGASLVQQPHTRVWRAKLTIPAARDCRVENDETPYGWAYTYHCTDGLPGLDYLAAKAALRAYAAKLQFATGLNPGPMRDTDNMAAFRYPSGAFIQLQLAPVMESRPNRLEILIEAPRSF